MFHNNIQSIFNKYWITNMNIFCFILDSYLSVEWTSIRYSYLYLCKPIKPIGPSEDPYLSPIVKLCFGYRKYRRGNKLVKYFYIELVMWFHISKFWMIYIYINRAIPFWFIAGGWRNAEVFSNNSRELSIPIYQQLISSIPIPHRCPTTTRAGRVALLACPIHSRKEYSIKTRTTHSAFKISSKSNVYKDSNYSYIFFFFITFLSR